MAIDSLVYMKMRALTSLAALKIKDTIVVPSACFRTRKLNGGGSGVRKWNSTNTTEQSELLLSVRPPDSCDSLRCKGEQRGAGERKSCGQEDHVCADQRVKGHCWEKKLEAGLKNCSFKIKFSLHWLVTRR